MGGGLVLQAEAGSWADAGRCLLFVSVFAMITVHQILDSLSAGPR
jgi:hypothetical protein